MTSKTTFPRFWGATNPFLIPISSYHHGNLIKSKMAAPKITNVMIHEFIILVMFHRDDYFLTFKLLELATRILESQLSWFLTMK